MNQPLGNNHMDDPERFKENKTRFEFLKNEPYFIQEKWKKLHDELPDEHHLAEVRT